MYVFLIAGRNQATDYARVQRFLGASTAIMLGAADLRVAPCPTAEETAAHVPPTDARRTLRLVRRLEQLRRRFGRFTLVSGQDVGTLQRVAFSWASARGCGRALVPDGVAFAPPPRGSAPTGSALGRVRALADRSGLLRGTPDALGGTDPDLIASWGSGWNTLWAAQAPGAEIAVTGSPRLDELDALPPVAAGDRILLASQPLWQGGFEAGPDDLDRWYRWLAGSASELAKTASVRVRLHPAEHGDADEYVARHGLGAHLRDGPLDEALGWASHVVAPASTIVLEAAAAGRRAALVAATPRVAEKWAASPLFAAEGWTRLSLDEPLRVDRLAFAAFDDTRFLVHVGGAAEMVAAALRSRFE